MGEMPGNAVGAPMEVFLLLVSCIRHWHEIVIPLAIIELQNIEKGMQSVCGGHCRRWSKVGPL